MNTKVYRDNDTIIVATNDKKIIRKLAQLMPECFEGAESLDLAPGANSFQGKEAERTAFGRGTYHGLKPSDYVEQHGVEGALRLSSEKGIPAEMRGEIIRVCALSIKNDIENRINTEISKSEFIDFVKLYSPMVGAEMSKVLARIGCGTIENYCAEKDIQTIRNEYKRLCEGIHKRVSSAL